MFAVDEDPRMVDSSATVLTCVFQVFQVHCVFQVLSFLPDYSTALLIGAMVLLMLRLAWNGTRYSGKLPPGPRGLPFIGYLPFLGKDDHVTFCKLSKTYGPIIRIQVGAVNVIVLNDFDSIQRGLMKRELLNRPQTLLLEQTGISDVVLLNGEAWVDNRKYCLHALSDLGFGKTSMEQHIKKEIGQLIAKMSASSGSPMPIHDDLVPSISNIITALVFGSRYPYNDWRRLFLDDTLKKLTKFFATSTGLNILPAPLNKLVLLPFTRASSVTTVISHMQEFVAKEVELHKATLEERSNRDFIDGYLKKMNESPPGSHFTLNHLLGNIISFFGAGSVSVELNIHWHLLNCAHRLHDVQERIQKEIDEVIGQERAPAWEDRSRMNFTMATIWEMHRWRPIAPMGVPRCVSEDTYVGGYVLPAGSVVMPNLWAVHMNPDVWNNPEEFNPERFLQNNGTKLGDKPEHLIPFSLGKRMCPGETLATMEIFLYLTSILQKFTVLPEEEKSIDMRAHSKIVMAPAPQQLRFVAR